MTQGREAAEALDRSSFAVTLGSVDRRNRDLYESVKRGDTLIVREVRQHTLIVVREQDLQGIAVDLLK